MAHSEGLRLRIASLSVTNKHKPKCLFIWWQTFLAIKCVLNASLSLLFLYSALTMTDKFSVILKTELLVLIERPFRDAVIFLRQH